MKENTYVLRRYKYHKFEKDEAQKGFLLTGLSQFGVERTSCEFFESELNVVSTSWESKSHPSSCTNKYLAQCVAHKHIFGLPLMPQHFGEKSDYGIRSTRFN